jgi:dephospho-CoA kinase
LQRARLQLRDGTPPAQADAILAAQAPREKRLAAADDVIGNTADLPGLARAVEDLHARYLQLAKASCGAI